MNKYKTDDRLPQVKKILEGALSKTYLNNSSIMITIDNKIVVLVYDTTIYFVEFEYPNLGLENIAFTFSDFNSFEEGKYINNELLLNKMNNLWNFYYNSLYNTELITKDEDLRSNPEFEKLLGLKSTDGARFFKLPVLGKINHFCLIPVFSGFPNLNKNDRVGIEVRRFEDKKYLLNHLIIYKKKINKNVHMIYRTLDIT